MADHETLIIRLLTGVPILAGTNHHDVKELLAHAKCHKVSTGEAVVVEGDFSRDFYIALSGSFVVAKKTGSRNKLIATLNPGSTFGEMSYLDGRPRAASVISEGDGLVLKFGRHSLDKIPHVASKLHLNLAGLLVSRMRDTNDLISLAIGEQDHAAAGVPEGALSTHRNFKIGKS